jgi:nitrate reductase / nitrite oxidoreductase, alpha subunit
MRQGGVDILQGIDCGQSAGTLSRNRDWERIYRDIFRTDGSFVFLCAPNDTHNCLLRAFTKNNVVVRVQPTYGYGKATDLHGNGASTALGSALLPEGAGARAPRLRRRRVKGAFLRKGFKDWVDAGFPRDPETGAVAGGKYLNRGFDTGSGQSRGGLSLSRPAYLEHRRDLLRRTGRALPAGPGLRPRHDRGQVERCRGTRTFKHRGGMAYLGATRIFGTFRMGNSMALLDAHIRGVGPDEAKGAGAWDSYSFHTDLPPGHPWCRASRPTTSSFTTPRTPG